MKKIKFIYATMLLVLALAMNACDDYYSVTVNGDPGITPTVLITPEESITLPAKEAAGEIEIISNMDNSTISFHVPSDAERWCSVTLEGNRISLALEDNPRMIARSTILTIKVFSVTRKIEVVQEAKAAEPIYPIEKVYKFKIPSVENFDISKIYKVMDDKLKVAEICLEYLKNDHIASKAVVVYTGQGGAADYTRGLVAYLVDDDGNVSDIDKNGGTVAFNYNENTLDYVAGNSNAVQTVYLSAFGITTEEQENAVEVVAEPYLVADISGNSYPTVKIGSEVWLGTNLRTTKFGDGSEIPFSAMNSLNQQVASYTYPGGDSDVDASLYGYLYTSKVVADEDLLVGSIVDGLWRISTGGGNNSNGLMGNVTDWQRLFKYIGQDQLGTLLAPGYNWNNGGNGAFDINTVSDLTGLSIVPAGQIYSNGAFALGYLGQAFFFYGNAGQGYNLAERDGKAADQAGVRQWNHVTDACSIRLVRIDNHQ